MINLWAKLGAVRHGAIGQHLDVEQVGDIDRIRRETHGIHWRKSEEK